MRRYVAFLRGINVGGHRIRMAALREIFEEMGFSGVSTFIASGNVIFSAGGESADVLTDRIEGRLAERLGYDVATFLRTPAEIEAIASHEPGNAVEQGGQERSTYVILLRDRASDDLRATLSAMSSANDEFRFSGREIYWHTRGRLTESPLFGGALERATRGIENTMRNITTLRRLRGKMHPS